MEFPDLGQHCCEQDCLRLDFLPVKCDCCAKYFCGDHYPYERHGCPEAYKKNVMVPACPICNAPVPGKPHEIPDVRVWRHIELGCDFVESTSATNSAYHRCSLRRCMETELVPIVCWKCQRSFCVFHRLPEDHLCGNRKLLRREDSLASSAGGKGEDKVINLDAQPVERNSKDLAHLTGNDEMTEEMQARPRNPVATSRKRKSCCTIC